VPYAGGAGLYAGGAGLYAGGAVSYEGADAGYDPGAPYAGGAEGGAGVVPSGFVSLT
jgi:hypothetical protein